MNRASEVGSKVGRKCEKLYPPRPPAWEGPDMPEDVRAAFRSMTVEDMASDNRPAIYAAWSKEIKARRAANKALQDAHHAKREEINREFGLDAAEDAFGERNNELWDLGLRIFATPATTLEGMAIKDPGVRPHGASELRRRKRRLRVDRRRYQAPCREGMTMVGRIIRLRLALLLLCTANRLSDHAAGIIRRCDPAERH